MLVHGRFTSLALAFLVFAIAGVTRAGTISGRLIDQMGNPVRETIEVAIGPFPFNEQNGQSTRTDNGEYSFDNLNEGSYWIGTKGVSDTTWFYKCFYPGVVNPNEAQPVWVSQDGQTNQDLMLPIGGRITGSVTPADGGQFAEGEMQLSLETYGPGGMSNIDNPGNFRSDALPPGQWKVRFIPGGNDLHVPMYYGDALDFDSAPWVTINSMSVTNGISASLPPGGGISGNVTGRNGALHQSYVEIIGIAADPTQGMTMLRQVSPDDQGNYTIRGIASDVLVHFDDFSGEGYASQWYENAYDIYSATMVHVQIGQVTGGINAVLDIGATMNGTLRTPGGGIPNFQQFNLNAYQSGDTWENEYQVQLDQGGNWTLPATLPPGVFSFRYGAFQQDNQQYADTWAGGAVQPWSANWYATGLGWTVGPINLILQQGGVIQGSVRDPSGNPVQNADVRLYHGDMRLSGFGTSTDESGQFRMINLPVGDYKMSARMSTDDDPNVNSAWPAIWSGNVNDQASAHLVSVVANQQTQADLRFVRGGMLTMQVSRPGGGSYDMGRDQIAIVGIVVDANNALRWDEPSWPSDPPFISDQGMAVMLPEGEYAFVAAPISLSDEAPAVQRTFYGGSFDLAHAQRFAIRAGQRTDLQMTMVEGGHRISGEVTGQGGQRLPFNPAVFVTDEQGQMVCAFVNFMSFPQVTNYSIPGLPDGAYKLIASTTGDQGISHLVSSWYPNIADPGRDPENLNAAPQGAGTVNVAGGDVSDVTIVMQNVQNFLGVADDHAPALPTGIELTGVYPNPFNATTSITFTLPYSANATLKVYNILGGEVATVTAGHFEGGAHKVAFDGSQIASGVYLVRLEAEGVVTGMRMVLLK